MLLLDTSKVIDKYGMKDENEGMKEFTLETYGVNRKKYCIFLLTTCTNVTREIHQEISPFFLKFLISMLQV